MALTAKQEAFAQAVVSGMNQSAAYRHAYDPVGSSPSTIAENASHLASDTNVAPRIVELRETAQLDVRQQHAWDLDKVVEELAVNVYGARLDKQWSASTGAVVALGKAIGVLTDKVDVNVTHTLKPGLSLEELEARVARLHALESGVIVDGEAKVVEFLDNNDYKEGP